MSATLESKSFAGYFGEVVRFPNGTKGKVPAPIINIDGTPHQVHEYDLDHILKCVRIASVSLTTCIIATCTKGKGFLLPSIIATCTKGKGFLLPSIIATCTKGKGFLLPSIIATCTKGKVFPLPSIINNYIAR